MIARAAILSVFIEFTALSCETDESALETRFASLPPVTQFAYVEAGVTKDWSPDGKWLAYSSARSGNLNIWKMPFDGVSELLE